MRELLNQEKSNNIYQTKFSVEWLIENTVVKTFDPLTFEGYQRQIDETHARKIVDYINNKDFYFPTSIICASNNKLSEEFGKIRIVDGQHRVQAFKILKNEFPDRYYQIKDNEIPVIILEKPDLVTEIETFITINKTTKTVDTSLAYVLKNKINEGITNEISNKSRREYLAVEAARLLNKDSKYILWNEKILYEGSIKNRYEYITLNGFVRSMRALLGALERKRIVNCNWDNSITVYELEKKIEIIANLVEYIWEVVYQKWPELKTDNQEDSRIIQGTIGFTTINRYLINRIKDYYGENMEDYYSFVKRSILYDIKVSADKWKTGGIYSKFTSESGYKAIVDDLLGNGLG